MSLNNKRPLVGLQVLVFKDDKVLIGFHKQKDVFGVPGGHWESGETLEEGAKREVLEESGIICDELEFVCNLQHYREQKKRSYLTVSFTANYVSGEFKDNNEEGTMDWEWISLEDAMDLELYDTAVPLLDKVASARVKV